MHFPNSPEHEPNTAQSRKLALVLAALGVVYGDIGTSPIYTIRESISAAGQEMGLEPAVLGVLSLIFWAIAIVISLKYALLIMRADNKGEGGVLSLSALALRTAPKTTRGRIILVLLSLAGVSLFGGDGLITPAISVLSAVEGLGLIAPEMSAYAVPIAGAILIGLFAFQSRGTQRVGRLFGPLICVWFATLAILGVVQIVREPDILRALNPVYGIALLMTGDWRAPAILGSVLLAITGGEALYADMGHFGRSALRIGWFGLVSPALLLNYFGQGALILRAPGAAADPFFLLTPAWGTVPLVLLTTIATVIASQAVISGGFSLTRQAVQLGYLPRMTVRHTSQTERGQIYMPLVNWLMMLGVLALVLGFGSSSAIAGAYGIAVMGTMSITTILAIVVADMTWRWPRALIAGVFGPLLAVDLAFLAATFQKIPNGGWFPLICAIAGSAIMWTWWRGRTILTEQVYGRGLSLGEFLERLSPATQRVAGTAVFMTGTPGVVPPALLHSLKHGKTLHDKVVLLTVMTEDVPNVAPAQRAEVNELGKGFYAVMLRFGFMEDPDVPAAIEECAAHGLVLDVMQTSFYLGRETLVPSARSRLPKWQQRLFIALSTNAMNATAFFRIPPGRVVEMGTQIEI